MNFELPSKIFEEDLGELLFGLNGFHFYKKNEIGEGQIGYRCNSDYVKIEDWIGENYFVIGYETLLGDPIIVNIEDSKLPVYSMVHDDWSILYKIANSIDDYRKILKMIIESDLSEKEIVEKILREIELINKGIEISYWEDLLLGVYEDVSNFYQ